MMVDRVGVSTEEVPVDERVPRYSPAPRQETEAFFDGRHIPEVVRHMHFPWALWDLLCLNEGFAGAFYDLVSEYLQSRMTMPPRQREIIILRVAALTGAEYESAHHTEAAESAGVTREEVARLSSGHHDGGWSDHDDAVICATEELVKEHRVTDETWSRLTHHEDHAGILEIIGLVGSYVMTAMILRSFDVPDE